MHTPQFETLVAPARHHPQIWRILLGLLIIVFATLGTFAMILVGLFPVIGPMEYFAWIRQLTAPDTPGHVLVLLLSFFGLALGAILAAGTCHLRGAGTLFGPAGRTLRGFLIAAAALVPLYAAGFALGWVLLHPDPGLPLARWLSLLPFALPLVLLQTTAEEMVFRGYLMQQLAARFRARWIWMGVPALLFTALHFDPTAGLNTWLMLIVIFAFALIAADLTVQTGSLGAAMGLHFINNVFAMLILSVDDTITGLALYITPFDTSDGALLPLGLAIDLVMLTIVWRMLRALLTR